MSALQRLAEDLYARAIPHKMLGLHLGTRMTVVRLPSGGLFVHSPVPLDEALRAEIDALGPVRHIVCPNVYHHSYAGGWVAAYPEARLHAPLPLAKKRRDLTIQVPLSTSGDADWAGALVPVPILGSLLHETVFVHRPSRTLVCSDLVENFVDGTGHLVTDLYLRASGIYGRPGWNRFMRFVYRDRAAARASLGALLSLDFDRVVLAHGSIIEQGGKDAVRATFRFLGELPT